MLNYQEKRSDEGWTLKLNPTVYTVQHSKLHMSTVHCAAQCVQHSRMYSTVQCTPCTVLYTAHIMFVYMSDS